MKQNLLAYALLSLLAAIWGSSFLFIKVALTSITPLTIAAGRIAVAAITLAVIASLAKQHLPLSGRHWRYIFAAAIFGNVLPFTMISVGEQHIDSSLAAILMATVPLFTIVVANFMTHDECLTRHKIAGVALGFAGIIILIGPEALLSLGDNAKGQLLVATACLSYAVSGILSRNLRGLSKLASGAAILTIGSLIIVPVALIVEKPWQLMPSVGATGSVLALGFASTAMAQVLILSILQLRDATFLSLNNYLVPIFGLIWGFTFLGEQPGPNTAIAVAVIFIGVFISQGGLKRLGITR